MPSASRAPIARRTRRSRRIAAAAHLDWGFVEEGRKLSDFALLAMDMDSTLISIECIDEIADFAGRKAEVAAVTASAMRGEIDWPESLRRRVKALAGLDESALERVYCGAPALQQGRGAPRRGRAEERPEDIAGLGRLHLLHRSRARPVGHRRGLFQQRSWSKGGKLEGIVVAPFVDAKGKAAHVARLERELGIAKRPRDRDRRRRQRLADDADFGDQHRVPREARRPGGSIPMPWTTRAWTAC